MNNQTFRITLLFCLFFGASSLYSDVVIRTMPEGKTVSARSFEQDGLTYVSMTDFALQAGFRWRWNIFTRKLTFSYGDTELSFVQNNSFYKADTATFQLAHPPVRKWATMYLPVPHIIEIFGMHYPGKLSWDEKSRAIRISSSSPVSNVRYEAKQNGTVVFITLGDSLAFECSYFHPNLLVSFDGGTVDEKRIQSSSKKEGVVDSVFGIQFENSAQVTFLLNRKIEKPHVDFNGESNTLMLSLKPKPPPVKVENKKVQVDVPLVSTVVIDPGHGGKDPGAIGPKKVKEKDVVLAVSLELKKHLEKQGLKVFLTREKDVFVPLANRTKFANDKKADLFLSIHANAIAGSKQRRGATKGYKIYFLSQAKNEDDKLAAMRENSVIELEEKPQKYSALQNILIDIAGNEYLKQSQELCITMDQTFNAKLSKIPKLHLGVGQANFWVLNGAYMPSVLVELGFISNPDEEKLLSSKKTQRELATALCEAILNFKQQFETGL